MSKQSASAFLCETQLAVVKEWAKARRPDRSLIRFCIPSGGLGCGVFSHGRVGEAFCWERANHYPEPVEKGRVCPVAFRESWQCLHLNILRTCGTTTCLRASAFHSCWPAFLSFTAVSSPSSFTMKTNTLSTSVPNSYYPGNGSFRGSLFSPASRNPTVLATVLGSLICWMCHNPRLSVAF